MKGFGHSDKAMIFLIPTLFGAISGGIIGKKKKIQHVNDPNFMNSPLDNNDVRVEIIEGRFSMFNFEIFWREIFFKLVVFFSVYLHM